MCTTSFRFALRGEMSCENTFAVGEFRPKFIIRARSTLNRHLHIWATASVIFRMPRQPAGKYFHSRFIPSFRSTSSKRWLRLSRVSTSVGPEKVTDKILGRRRRDASEDCCDWKRILGKESGAKFSCPWCAEIRLRFAQRSAARGARPVRSRYLFFTKGTHQRSRNPGGSDRGARCSALSAS